ncbi:MULTISPECIES: hypothetical protein [unclassified Streptomyces]|uniref:hypothetical protein n=1 Tax=unclassified Streptomyces TaxID=2593676 RepID=UPI002E14F219|nr:MULTISPECIES: hypothetical protein [unclassified Streptomyces]WSR26672.1 hypothetical protein OG573_11350 [Streptomyces sp. NBC_01205]
MKLNRTSLVGALAGTVLLLGGAPAQAVDNPLLSLLDNLNVSDISEVVHVPIERVLNPNIVLSNGNVAALQDTAESLLAKPAATAVAPAVPAAPAAKPAAPAAP